MVSIRPENGLNTPREWSQYAPRMVSIRPENGLNTPREWSQYAPGMVVIRPDMVLIRPGLVMTHTQLLYNCIYFGTQVSRRFPLHICMFMSINVLTDDTVIVLRSSLSSSQHSSGITYTLFSSSNKNLKCCVQLAGQISQYTSTCT
jgi:hypothetical protein